MAARCSQHNQSFFKRIHDIILEPFVNPVSKAVDRAFDDAFHGILDPEDSPANFAPAVEGDYRDVARMLLASKYTVVLTGAGISQESGIPTFRDVDNGVWTHNSYIDCASIYGFDKDPAQLWALMKTYHEAREPVPNDGHIVLARLEEMGLVKAVVTQNVDGLHQEAGSRNVVQYHGSVTESVCRRCGRTGPSCTKLLRMPKESFPPCCGYCHGVLKPMTSLFDEALPVHAMREARDHAERATLILVIGTSARVMPACTLPGIVARNGGQVVEINLEHTMLTNTLTDMFVGGKAGVVLNTVLGEVKRLKAHV